MLRNWASTHAGEELHGGAISSSSFGHRKVAAARPPQRMRVGRGERERERPGEPRACTPVDQSKSEKEKERDSDELRKGKEIKREKKPLTLTIPNRSNRRTGKENQNRRGKKGKGVAYLAAVQRCCHVGAREKKGRTGAAARWARKKGRRGQAARRRRAHPLGSTRAGEGAGDGAKARSTA